MSNLDDLPKELLETEHVKKMLVLLFPCIVKKSEFKNMSRSPIF